MAVSSTIVWQFSTAGSANMTGGGGWNSLGTGTDWSQLASPKYALTGLASAGSGNTVLYASASADMVGNVAHCISGTNFTTGWFEILSVSVGVSITFGTNGAAASICTGVGANGVINIGGALNTGALEGTFAAQVQNGNTIWFAGGTYTFATSMTFSDFTGNTGVLVSGYNVTRGDNPLLSARPFLNLGGQNIYFGNGFLVQYLSFQSTAASAVQTTQGIFKFCKAVNSSTTTARNGIALGSGTAIACEATSYRGNGIAANANPIIDGCYIHDSNVGVLFSTNSPFTITKTLIETCGSSAIFSNSATSTPAYIEGCTLFGALNKRGTGISINAGGFSNLFVKNTIISGFNIGIFHSSVVSTVSCCGETNNNYFNNSTDVSNWNKDSTSTSLDPQFLSVQQITGSTAVTNGSVLIDTGAAFAGIVGGQDYCLITGSSITTGFYLISTFTSTSLTLIPTVASSIAPIVYQITTGHNFGVGSNMKAIGAPGNFGGSSAGLSFSYNALGAIQEQAVSGGSFAFTG